MRDWHCLITVAPNNVIIIWHYSEQQRTTRLKARRARVAEEKRGEENARLALFGISPPNNVII